MIYGATDSSCQIYPLIYLKIACPTSSYKNTTLQCFLKYFFSYVSEKLRQTGCQPFFLRQIPALWELKVGTLFSLQLSTLSCGARLSSAFLHILHGVASGFSWYESLRTGYFERLSWHAILTSLLPLLLICWENSSLPNCKK